MGKEKALVKIWGRGGGEIGGERDRERGAVMLSSFISLADQVTLVTHH